MTRTLSYAHTCAEEHNLLQSSSQFNRLSPEGGSTPVHESMGNDINGSTGDRFAVFLFFTLLVFVLLTAYGNSEVSFTFLT